MENLEKKEAIPQLSYGLLDPRPTPEAEEKNKTLLGANTLGIEVTIPKLAEKLELGNIDPQHTEGKDEAAIEAALVFPLPEKKDINFVTIRADLDSVGAMAVISLRAHGQKITEEVFERIKKIAVADKTKKEKWPGPQPLPSKETPWSFGESELAAIAAEVADFKVPLEKRVEAVKNWLLTGKKSEKYRKQVNEERENLIKALENNEIKVKTYANDSIALVISKHRAATSIGYNYSPVVLALNPEFSFPGSKESYKKFTISQFDSGFIDLNKVKEELNKLEPGWGGQENIIGSPQGVSSRLKSSQIIEIMAKNLLVKNEN